jgi:hypothetical protein
MRRAWVLALALVACGRDGFWDRPLGASGPYALDDRAAWLLAGEPAVALYDPAADRLTRVPLEAKPLSAVPAPDGHGLLVLDEDGGATWIVPGEAPRRYALGAPLDSAAWAPDGGRVVLHASAATNGAIVSNPNEVAILDLSKPPAADNPVRRTLRSFGAVPQAVVVAPTAQVAGAERQLAWVLSERYLALIDLAAPKAREVVVHLTLPDDDRPVTPSQVIPAEVAGRPTAFVRAEGSDDVFALDFPADAAAGEVPRPSLNLLPCGATPRDVVVEALADGTRVFAANGDAGTVAVIDPVTGRQRLVDVGAPVHRILPFTAPRAEGGDGRFALLWSPGGDAVVFADLDRLEQRAGQALTPLRLEGRVVEVAPLPGRRGAAARLDNERLALLDFDDRTATPLLLSEGSRLGELRIDPTGARVYAAIALANGGGALAAVDTADASSTVAPMDDGDGTLLLLPGARRLLFDHGDETGTVTVASMDDLGGSAPRERSGLLLEGMLDR